MRSKLLSFLIITFFLSTFLFAQQPVNYTIYGVVTDSASGQPIANVLVEVINEADTTEWDTALTNSSGNYSINLIVSDIHQFKDEMPTNFKLSQNYPNPFNPSTIIGFQLPKVSDVQLIVYNILGQKIKTIVNQKLTAGIFSAVWDGTNDIGLGVAAGVYFYRFSAGPSTGSPKGQAGNEFVKTRKMVLLDGSAGGLSNSSSSVLKKETNIKNLQKSENLQVTIRATSPLIHTLKQEEVNVTSQNHEFDIEAQLFFGYINPDKIIVSEPGLNSEIYISGLPFAVIYTTTGLREVSSLNKRTLDVDTTGIYSHGGFPIMIMDAIVGDSIVFNLFRDSLLVGDPIELIVRNNIAPSVIDSKPTNGDKDIPIDGVISINFSEPVDTTSVSETSFTLKDSLGNIIPGLFGFRSGNTGFFFEPNQSMMPFSKYTITVTTDITDLQGLHLDTIYTASFTTSFWSILEFTKDPNNPVMSGRGSGTWNMHVGMPCVLFNPDSVRYEMWYVGMLGSPNWRPYSIGYAFSDDGITWTKLDSAVLTATPGSWDESTVEWPRVIRENGQYKMWYTGWSPTVDGIGYATSPDGINWTKHPTPVLSGVAAWASGGFGYCTVLPVPTGYKMWFTGWNASYTGSNIGYASSSDGISWQRDTTNNPVLRNGDYGQWDDQFVALPGVNYIDNTYYMWFNGNYPDAHARHRQVGLAISTDGIQWIKYDDTNTTSLLYAISDPVLEPSPNQWDGTYVENGSVLLISDTLHIWYCGALYPDATNKWRIGHATAPFNPVPVIK